MNHNRNHNQNRNPGEQVAASDGDGCWKFRTQLAKGSTSTSASVAALTPGDGEAPLQPGDESSLLDTALEGLLELDDPEGALRAAKKGEDVVDRSVHGQPLRGGFLRHEGVAFFGL